MHKRLDLQIKPEDQVRLDTLIEEIGDIINRSSKDPTLVLDFEYWAETIFPSTKSSLRRSKFWALTNCQGSVKI